MSEFKFRAYVNSPVTEVYMVYWDLILGDRVVYSDREMKNRIDYSIHRTGHDEMTILSTSPIMRYTGLKDKNGKEIYEGDILKESPVPTYKGYRLVEVKFDCSAFVISHTYPYPTEALLALNLIRHNLEVVGNIYENPDLIK